MLDMNIHFFISKIWFFKQHMKVLADVFRLLALAPTEEHIPWSILTPICIESIYGVLYVTVWYGRHLAWELTPMSLFKLFLLQNK